MRENDVVWNVLLEAVSQSRPMIAPSRSSVLAPVESQGARVLGRESHRIGTANQIEDQLQKQNMPSKGLFKAVIPILFANEVGRKLFQIKVLEIAISVVHSGESFIHLDHLPVVPGASEIPLDESAYQTRSMGTLFKANRELFANIAFPSLILRRHPRFRVLLFQRKHVFPWTFQGSRGGRDWKRSY